MEYVTYMSDNQDQWKQGLIDCYKAVFAAPPWNEDWWTDELVQEVLDQYAGPNARIILATHEESVIGFAWGAVWTASQLVIELGLPLPETSSRNVGYIKDIGVSESFRQKGIAEALLKELIKTISQSCVSNDWIYARTLAVPDPSIVYQWFPSLGFKVVSKYPKEGSRNGQVILGCDLHSLTL